MPVISQFSQTRPPTSPDPKMFSASVRFPKPSPHHHPWAAPPAWDNRRGSRSPPRAQQGYPLPRQKRASGENLAKLVRFEGFTEERAVSF
jgi:hypothetical protein